MNNSEGANTVETKVRWFIDVDWYTRNNRSFLFLLRERLCPKCQKRLKTGKSKGEVTADKLLASIRDCCSESRDFISPKLPILESVFRILLANANQPLDTEELVKRLSEQRGNPYSISVESLSRLLASDEYYGLSQVPS
jgi:hypothetical protein